MKRDTLTLVISSLIIATHICALVFAFFVIGVMKGLEEFSTDLCAILAPMTGAYLVLIVQSAADKMNDQVDSGSVNRGSAWLFIAMVAIFVIALSVVLWAATLPSTDTGTIKGALGLIETGLGGYLAILMKKLFAS